MKSSTKAEQLTPPATIVDLGFVEYKLSDTSSLIDVLLQTGESPEGFIIDHDAVLTLLEHVSINLMMARDSLTDAVEFSAGLQH